MTTHSNVCCDVAIHFHADIDDVSLQIRIFLITAKYCSLAVWQDDRRRLIDLMRVKGLLSWSLLREYFTCWMSVHDVATTCAPLITFLRRYEKNYRTIIVVETYMDLRAYLVKSGAWLRGLFTKGFEGAHRAAAGLA
jgi:aarF domain-containing kinase